MDTKFGKEEFAEITDDSQGDVLAVHDVRGVLEHPESWLALIHTTPSGLRLLAKIENKEIVDLVVQDAFGRSVPGVVYQKKGGGKGKKTCRICVTIRGDTNCWVVPCDKIVILPKAVGTDQDTGAIEVYDIRGVFADQALTEGLNKVYTTPSGVQFQAKVEDGQITEWTAQDAEGNDLPTTVYQKKKPKKPKGEPIKCNVCTTQNGQTTCVEVPCEKILIKA